MMESRLSHYFSEELQLPVNFKPTVGKEKKFGHYSFPLGLDLFDDCRDSSKPNSAKDMNFNYQSEKLVEKMNLLLDEDHLGSVSEVLSQISHFKIFKNKICCFLRKDPRMDDEEL